MSTWMIWWPRGYWPNSARRVATLHYAIATYPGHLVWLALLYLLELTPAE